MSKRLKEIKEAIRIGKLVEPFGKRDLERACPGWSKGTYNAFLGKHRDGTPGNYKEYFQRVAPGKFRLLNKH